MYTENNSESESELGVRQGQFAVTALALDNHKTTLSTGYIGPCVAFYGRHKDNKVAFLSHIACDIRGYKSLIAELKNLTNEELEGFSLYLTTNYTLLIRIIILSLLIIWSFLATDKFYPLGVLITLFPLFFGSLILVYTFMITKFKKPKLILQLPFQLTGRVTVSISATSNKEPKPDKETLDTKSSKKRFRSRNRWNEGLQKVVG